MDTPSPQLPVDPNLATEQAQAQSDLVKSLTATTRGDMASLMARYGTQLALAGSTSGSPLVAPPVPFGGNTASPFSRAA